MTVGEVFDFTVNDSSLKGLILKIDSFTDVGQGGILGIYLILLVAGGIFLMSRSYGNERAFPVAMIAAFIIALLLRVFGLLSDTVFWVTVALLIVAVLLLLREQGQIE